MYHSPVIHAKRIEPDCYNLPDLQESLGHFKSSSNQVNMTDAVTTMMVLNKKEYDIHSQQKFCKGQIESLFEKTGLTEISTHQGLLIKTEEGLFIKIG